MTNDDAVGSKYWSLKWEKEKPPPIIKWLAHNYSVIKLLKKYITVRQPLILEIGCGPEGRWLKCLKKELGAEIYGIDYSLIGIKSTYFAIKNLNPKLILADAFHIPLKQEVFDLVFSMGVIEHYDNPEEIIQKHIDLVKPGGIVFIQIPNLASSSVNGIINKIFNEKISEDHNISIMEPEKFKNLFISLTNEMSELYCGPYGPLNLAASRWPFRSSPLIYIVHLINFFIGYITYILRINSRFISSSYVYIGRKKYNKE